MTNRHHNRGEGTLTPDDANKLWNHIRALETLEEQKADLAEDIKCRKEIVKADGFDTNIVGVIMKRRKAGQGQTVAADTLLQLYEDALEEQGVMPLEQTRKGKEAEERRSVTQVAQDLHGEDPPEDMFDPGDPPSQALN